jgi:hypothetical protein
MHMKIAKLKEEEPDEMAPYRSDVDRIVRVFGDRDIFLRPEDAYGAWRVYSQSRAAGWLILDDADEHIFKSIADQFDIQEEPDDRPWNW